MNLFFFDQDIDGIDDRTSTGTEVRYNDRTKSLFGMIDYDLTFKEINILQLNANLLFDHGRAAYMNAFLRKTPPLATSNALIGRPETSIEELMETLNIEQIHQLARDRTADSATITLGGSQPISEKFQANVDITFSKVGGTEAGVGDAPELTFSACFGAPFMVFHPAYYANLLKENLTKYQVKTWLLNTGLVGGPAGIGTRISIKHTRAILTAALDGSLNEVEYQLDPWFGFEVPVTCPGVPDGILNPIAAWADQDSYQTRVRELVEQFKKNMKKYEKSTPEEVLLAGPK